ncbi:MAG: hypothetical protein V1649_01685 [Patescibacteria group bacterium]
MAITYKSSDIKRIAGSKFSKGEIGGKVIGGTGAKKYVSDLVKKGSGKTLIQISNELKKAGLRGGQENDRNRWLKAIEESKKKDKILDQDQIKEKNLANRDKQPVLNLRNTLVGGDVRAKGSAIDLGIRNNPNAVISMTQKFGKGVQAKPLPTKLGGGVNPIIRLVV